ncbi:unnamed protein product [Mytilus edulis]|uniref:P2X purinoreceptor 7 intracellular domain-containing protein n=1 Tax=Mytilus edulis TaxID=6550 RepID=A0A8S3QXL7_MYTED|nr:unnamed protein product [Mytilus edulis]
MAFGTTRYHFRRQPKAFFLIQANNVPTLTIRKHFRLQIAEAGVRRGGAVGEVTDGQSRPVRGRGHGRKVRGRRSVRSGEAAPNVADAGPTREALVQEHLNNISNDDLKRMVMRIYHRQPSIILDIIDVRDAGNGSPEIPPNREVPSWCKCSFCREMPNEIEKVCCKQTPVNCHSQLREFNTVVLDELVLEVARRMREDLMIDPHDDNFNRGNRHAAYRQYVLWIHGYLGAGNRRVIPSCVVWKIREKYPDPVGQYVGFEPGRLG